jgi:hypothetical protein
MNAAIREAWRKTIVTDEEWKQHADAARPVRTGEAAGFLVRSGGTGLIGYLKPLNAPRGPGHARPAYEKIASDLAYEVSVNVPPVILYRRSDAKGAEPKEVSISFSWGGASPWSDVFNIESADGGAQPGGLAAMIKRLAAGSCEVMALDAWLRNTDRHNPGNAILAYGSEEDPGQLFFIDYANAMDYDGEWSKAEKNHQVFRRLPCPPILAGNAVKARVQAAARRIADLGDTVVAEIICRIPDDFLLPAARRNLLEWLLWRKQHLVSAFDLWYAGN